MAAGTEQTRPQLRAAGLPVSEAEPREACVQHDSTPQPLHGVPSFLRHTLCSHLNTPEIRGASYIKSTPSFNGQHFGFFLAILK